ncbi:MAG: T9SS type A sorting domain-containing protein, partial [Muribaculaceae bacterium]|nr:T9SS type A sorting domain-containing protein [Muribaculaceae bacterium]
HQVMVYALTGQIVKNETAEYGRTLIDLPRGYYIVKVDKVAKRVIIK